MRHAGEFSDVWVGVVVVLWVVSAAIMDVIAGGRGRGLMVTQRVHMPPSSSSSPTASTSDNVLMRRISSVQGVRVPSLHPPPAPTTSAPLMMLGVLVMIIIGVPPTNSGREMGL